MHKVVRQDEGNTLSVDPKFTLEVAQEMAKVDVEQLHGDRFKWLLEVFRLTDLCHSCQTDESPDKMTHLDLQNLIWNLVKINIKH